MKGGNERNGNREGRLAIKSENSKKYYYENIIHQLKAYRDAGGGGIKKLNLNEGKIRGTEPNN